uniref:ATP synthase subunit 8 n=1 Tax=Argas sp. SpringbokSA-QMS95171 TaxID=1442167 RepID=W0FGN2_9ACAR|nr:ATP synthase subunit 8 [Argas sp. SpringbokSA-QMS95171]
MPQLFPMNWIFLSLTTLFMIYLFMNLVYFTFFYKEIHFKPKSKKFEISWKW